jgi:hypothetical protein
MKQINLCVRFIIRSVMFFHVFHMKLIISLIFYSLSTFKIELHEKYLCQKETASSDIESKKA